MNEVFTLRQSSMAIETKTERCGLGIRDITDGYQVVEMSCKIYRRNEQKQWLECDFGEMKFQDSQGNLHKGFYNDSWWRAQIQLKEPMEGVEYWPHELNEGSMQYINTCETKRMAIAFPEREIDESPFIIPTFVETEEEISEEVRPIKELPKSRPPKGIKTWSLTDEGKEIVEQVKEIVDKVEARLENDDELPPPPPVYQCPICGITTTKTGSPFKSWNSVKTHALAIHEIRLINEKDRVKC